MITLDLSALGGTAATAATATSYRVLEAGLDRREAAYRQRPAVAREIDYFKARIGKVGSAAELVADPRLLRFVMTAYDLADEAGAKALVRRVLEQGTSSPTALANRLNDGRWRDLAKAFDFGSAGKAAELATASFQDAMVDRYVTAGVESEVSAGSTALGEAMYFKRKAAQITSWYQVLGDRKLYDVVRTALGLPASIANAGIDRQARILEQRVGLARLGDAKSVDRLITQFLARGQGGSGGTGLASLLSAARRG